MSEPIDRRQRKSTLEIATFLYHDVSDNPSDSGFQRYAALPYKHSIPAFKAQLDCIASSDMVPKLVSEIAFDKSGRHLMLTFDDGGKSAVRIAEILATRGWKCHFFVTTSLIGTPTFLDASEIKSIRQCGHIIGSHSHSHPDIFKAQPFEKMVQEWRISCDRISDLLSEPCYVASVPGGDSSQRVIESATNAGIRYLFTSEPVLTPRTFGDCHVIGRMCSKASTPPKQVGRLARFEGWGRELAVRRLKLVARTVGFPLYKLYVQRTTSAH